MAYIAAAMQLGWLLQEIEERLLSLDDGAYVDVTILRRFVSRRLPTHDQLDASASALICLGILDPSSGSTYSLNRRRLLATRDYRAGIHEAFAFQSAETSSLPKSHLCVSLPPGLDYQIEREVREQAADLRSAIVDLIAGSSINLVLAAPFWDSETIADLEEVLIRRLEAGVEITLLGRFNSPGLPSIRKQLSELTSWSNCTILDWFEPDSRDPFGSLTFHFKAVVSDHGERAYLGTANFTAAGLRSRMEIGVLLYGEMARTLFNVVRSVLRAAHRARIEYDQ